MTDDPLDLAQVSADEAAIEQLRLRAAPPDDSALQLLHDLLVDVDRDLPQELPVGSGSTVLRLAGETAPETRVARGGAVVAMIAAGVVAFGGVAAASTAVAPGNPLHGLGESVRSAAGAVVEAVKPPDTTRRAEPEAGSLPAPASSRATEAITSRPSVPVVPGPEVAAQARSEAAARQVVALLDEAEALLEQGRAAAAGQRLDVAERRLTEVAGDAAAPLRVRLGELREAVQGATAPTRTGPAPKAEPEPKSEPKAGGRPEPKQEPRTGPRAEPAPDPAGQPQEPGMPAAERSADDEAEAPAARRTFVPRQPSRLASAKPRA